MANFGAEVAQGILTGVGEGMTGYFKEQQRSRERQAEWDRTMNSFKEQARLTAGIEDINNIKASNEQALADRKMPINQFISQKLLTQANKMGLKGNDAIRFMNQGAKRYSNQSNEAIYDSLGSTLKTYDQYSGDEFLSQFIPQDTKGTQQGTPTDTFQYQQSDFMQPTAKETQTKLTTDMKNRQAGINALYSSLTRSGYNVSPEDTEMMYNNGMTTSNITSKMNQFRNSGFADVQGTDINVKGYDLNKPMGSTMGTDYNPYEVSAEDYKARKPDLVTHDDDKVNNFMDDKSDTAGYAQAYTKSSMLAHQLRNMSDGAKKLMRAPDMLLKVLDASPEEAQKYLSNLSGVTVDDLREVQQWKQQYNQFTADIRNDVYGAALSKFDINDFANTADKAGPMVSVEKVEAQLQGLNSSAASDFKLQFNGQLSESQKSELYRRFQNTPDYLPLVLPDIKGVSREVMNKFRFYSKGLDAATILDKYNQLANDPKLAQKYGKETSLPASPKTPNEPSKETSLPASPSEPSKETPEAKIPSHEEAAKGVAGMGDYSKVPKDQQKGLQEAVAQYLESGQLKPEEVQDYIDYISTH